GGDRGRHGDQGSAAQPARGGRGRAVVPRQLRGHRRGAARGPHQAGEGPRLPDPRPDRRAPRHRGGLPDRTGRHHHARRGRGGGGLARAHAASCHRAALPGQPGQPGVQDRRAGARRQDRRDRRRAGRVQRPDRPAARDPPQAGRGRQDRAEQPVQAHPAPGDLRREHARAGRRRARTLRLDQLIRHWVAHQINVIVRRTKYLLRRAQERAHIVRALLKALDQIDAVIALIRASESAAVAQQGLQDLLDIDEEQARAILDMQLRRLAALERRQLTDEYDELMAQIADYEAILASPERQRQIISTELGEIVAKYGDARRTQIIPFDGDVTSEDLIAQEDVVVTITRGGYAKRTKTDLYRAQRRGGKGVRGAQLRTDDIVEHFFVTTTHHWILFFTNKGRVYRAKAYELPEAARDAKGQHVANLLAFQPDERIAQVGDLRGYHAAPTRGLARRYGLVKKTRLSEYDSNRTGGVIAINLRDGDELISARLVGAADDLLLVSRKGQSVRFTADGDALRPMGR